MSTRVTLVVAAGAAALVSGCFAQTSEVTLLHSQLPALAEGCPVSVLADTAAPFPVEDLAIVRVRYTPGGKDTAMAKLRERTCYYAGDTLYAITEEAQPNATTLLSARVARRTGAAEAPAPAPAK